MKNKMWNFVYSNLYLIWGTIVVCAVSLFTGAITAAIIGASTGIVIVSIGERLIR